MEGGCRTPTELKRIDDGGNFDRLRREAEEASKGDDEHSSDQILTERIVVEFVRMKALNVSSRQSPIMFPARKKPKTPRARPLAAASGFDVGFQPESETERKKDIKRWGEEVEQLKQKGLSLPLPEGIRDRLQELGGSANPVRLVIKHLFQTDLSEHHGRFNLPATKFVSAEEGGGFLTEAEWEALRKGETMKVRLLGPMCTEPTNMVLKKWNRYSGIIHILTCGWAKFLKKYKTEHKGVLTEGDGVQLWASRCDGGDLLVALQVIPMPPPPARPATATTSRCCHAH